ncbi:hypothetical protein J3F84DRAFT_240487 [Trichoderma pleuroticola]
MNELHRHEIYPGHMMTKIENIVSYFDQHLHHIKADKRYHHHQDQAAPPKFVTTARSSSTHKPPNTRSKKRKCQCVIWESNPGLPDAARMATENFTTKPITLGKTEGREKTKPISESA